MELNCLEKFIAFRKVHFYILSKMLKFTYNITIWWWPSVLHTAG